MIRIKIDEKALINSVNSTLRKKAPAAIARGLTRTAFDGRDDIQQSMPKYLDRPKPFTIRGVFIKKATATVKTAYIYIKAIQAAYLEYQIRGGSSTKRKAVPARTARLDAYGNLPRNATKGKNVYQGTDKKGRKVWYRKTGGGADTWLELLAFIPVVRNYRARFPFYKIGKTSVKQNIKKKIQKELNNINALN